MSGSGSREGFGSPPWNPAEPTPELEDTRTLPGLGALPGAAAGRANSGNAAHPGSNGASAWTASGEQDAGRQAPGSVDADSNGARVRGDAPPSPETGTETGGADGGGGDTDQPDGAEPVPGKQQRRRRRPRSALVELVVLGVIAVVLALIIKTFVVQPFFIPSASMENTLEIGDRVLVNKLVYDFRSIHRGDVIVFDGNGSWDFNPPSDDNIFSKFFSDLEGIVGISHDSSIYIKRVIGLPGDHVACCNAKGQLTVNGIALSEQSYLFPGNAPSTQKFSITVPAGRLWVMGDHRLVSYDSRGHMGDPGGGSIPESAVIGRAFVIIWPPSRWGVLNIPATFEQPKLNASAAAAMDNGTPLQTAGPVGDAVPLALGFAGAVPLTWAQRRVRRRISARRRRRR